MVADCLSKGDFGRARAIIPTLKEGPEWVPRTILEWVADPFIDMDL